MKQEDIEKLIDGEINSEEQCRIMEEADKERFVADRDTAIRESIKLLFRNENKLCLFPMPLRIFYVIKALICIGLNLKNEGMDMMEDAIAVWDYHCDYCGEWSWTQLDVGIGVFKNWYYNISYEY